MTHAERLRETAKSEKAAIAILERTSSQDTSIFHAYVAALLAGAAALDAIASLPHYDDCDKWAKADAPDGYEVVLDETVECTCALGVTRKPHALLAKRDEAEVLLYQIFTRIESNFISRMQLQRLIEPLLRKRGLLENGQ